MVPLEAFSLSCSPAGDAAADRKEQLQRQAGCAAARHFRRSCLTCRMPASKPKGILQDQLLEAQKSHKIGRLQITVSGVAEAEAAAAFFQVAMLCSVVIACPRAGPEGWFVSTPGVSCFDDKVSPLQKAEIVKIVRSGSYRSLNSQHSQPVPSGRPLSSLSPFFLSLFLLSLFPRRLSLLKSRKLPSSKRSFLAPTRTLLS